jgi:integrase
MAGLGSLEKRGPKTWRLVVSCGMKGDQQIKKKKTVTVKNSCEQSSCRGCAKLNSCRARKEANKLLMEYALEIEKGLLIDSGKLTFADFVERWIRDYAESNLAPKTLFRYKQMLNSRIFPAMGHLKIKLIRPAHLLEFYSNLQEDGIRLDGKPGNLSNQTILHHHRLISTIFTAAVQWEVIASNPASKVKPPKVTKQQIDCFDEEMVKLLLIEAGKEPLKHNVLVHLAVFSGLRRGEIMGLTWSDISFETNTLTVRQASQYIPGQGQFTKDPKTETSKRILSLPPFLISMLKEYKKEQNKARLKLGDKWHNSDRIFTTWDGRPGHPEWPSQWFPKFIRGINIRDGFAAVRSSVSDQGIEKFNELKNKYIKVSRLKEKATIEKSIMDIVGEKGLKQIQEHRTLPPLSFHGLRHVSATMLINLGLPNKSVSGRLGHSRIETTLNIYTDYLKSADKEAADRLEQVYQSMISKR